MTKAERVVLAAKCCFAEWETDCTSNGKRCPYLTVPSCNREFGRDLVAVIERQQAEIKKLKRKVGGSDG